MEGYNSIRQFVRDYKIYIAAKKLDPGKEGETITNYLRNKINKKIKFSSKQFKDIIKKRGYSMDDLKIIATHDIMKNIKSLEAFIIECFEREYSNLSPRDYMRLLSSEAFKSGRTKKLFELIPPKIETKSEFIRFLKKRRIIEKSELNYLMKYICKKNWKKWLYELVDKGEINENGTAWII